MGKARQLWLKFSCKVAAWFCVWLFILLTVLDIIPILTKWSSHLVLLVLFSVFTVSSFILLLFEIDEMRISQRKNKPHL